MRRKIKYVWRVRRRQRRWPIALAVLLLLLCVAGVGAAWWLRSPERALLAVARDVRSRGFNALADHMTDDCRERTGEMLELSQDTLGRLTLAIRLGKKQAAALSLLTANMNGVSWKLKGVRRTGDQAEITLAFSGSAVKGTLRVHMTRQDGRWLIDGYDDIAAGEARLHPKTCQIARIMLYCNLV